MEVGKPTHFTVQTKGAGKAPLEVQFGGPGQGPAVRDFEVIDNHDYSYTVKYTALQQVGYGGDPYGTPWGTPPHPLQPPVPYEPLIGAPHSI